MKAKQETEMHWGNYIYQYCKANRYTLAAVARKLNMSQDSFTSLLKRPTMRKLLVFILLYGCNDKKTINKEVITPHAFIENKKEVKADILDVTDSFRLKYNDTITAKGFLSVYNSENKITEKTIYQSFKKHFILETEKEVKERFLFIKNIQNNKILLKLSIYEDYACSAIGYTGEKVLVIRDLREGRVFLYRFDSIEMKGKKMALWMFVRGNKGSLKYIYLDKDRCYVPTSL